MCDSLGIHVGAHVLLKSHMYSLTLLLQLTSRTSLKRTLLNDPPPHLSPEKETSECGGGFMEDDEEEWSLNEEELVPLHSSSPDPEVSNHYMYM